MAVRINIEIGHEASLRTKRTLEGYTHDWKIFVRGCDGADIHYYVEKVVFELHDTFPKPRRAVKEPPYAVKESGYAGFNLPIEIYLRNNGEPKKIKFNYDLQLQPSGPPIRKVVREQYTFISPPDDFKQKLIRGGGIPTDGSSQDANESSKSALYEEKNQLYNKPKFSGSDPPAKKPKTEPQIPKNFEDFQNLFGTPITKTTKVTVPKPPAPKENKNTSKSEKEKSVEKVKNKHSPHKDKEKERDKSEKKAKDEKKKDKEKKDRERERSKEKSFKKEKSPQHNSPPPATFDQTKHQDKGDKEKKEKEEKKSKKEKREKDHNREKDKHRDGKTEHKERKSKSKEMFPAPKQSISSVSNAVQQRQEKKDEEKKVEKSEDKKHKHRKKDKNKKEREESEEKSHKTTKKTEKEKSSNENEKNLFGSSPKAKPVAPSPKDKAKPLNKLFNSFVEDASDSSGSSRDQSPPPPPPAETKKKKTKDDKQQEKEPEKRKRKKLSPVDQDQQQQQEKVAIKEEETTNNNSDADSKIKSEQPDSATSNDDYINILRSLKHKIMALKDNADLQKVVSLIAETGQYEISASTFDFDLCLLDRSVVKQLQDFLSTTS